MTPLPDTKSSGVGGQSEALPHCNRSVIDEYSYLSDACDADTGEASRPVPESTRQWKKMTIKKENAHMRVLERYSSFFRKMMAENTSSSNASLRSLRLQIPPGKCLLDMVSSERASSLHAYPYHPSDQWQPHPHQTRRDGWNHH